MSNVPLWQGLERVIVDLSGATSRTRKKAGSMRQLGEKKRQKSQSNSANNKLEVVHSLFLQDLRKISLPKPPFLRDLCT
jgi:hypothetical protein